MKMLILNTAFGMTCVLIKYLNYFTVKSGALLEEKLDLNGQAPFIFNLLLNCLCLGEDWRVASVCRCNPDMDVPVRCVRSGKQKPNME
jgi:hypothetical protein